MAEPNATLQPAATSPVPNTSVVADQYDLDDTDYNPEWDQQEPSKPISSQKPAVAEQPPASPSRPRNPDGTFKAAHSPRLSRMATDMGMTQAEIDELNPDALEAVVEQEYRRARAESAAQRTQKGVLDAVEPGDSPPEVPPAKPEEIDLGIDESQWDPTIVGLFKSQAQKIASLEARLNAVQGHQQAQVNASLTERADAVFGQHELLGKGKYHELTPDSPEMQRRNAVAMLVRADKSRLSLEQKLTKAIETLFPGAAAPTAPTKASPTPEEWAEAGLARPTQRNGSPEPKGPKRAKQAVAAILREQRGGQGDEELGLPE